MKDFLKDEDININCRNLTGTDNVTKFTSTRNNSPAPPSHSPVLAVSLDLSQITDTALRKMMEQHSSFFGDADFNTPCTHNTTHPIAFFDEMQRLGLIRPSQSPYASPMHMVPKKAPETGDRVETTAPSTKSQFAIRYHCHSFHRSHSTTKVFNKLDLVEAYHQIPMHPDDIEKTASTTPFGLFEFLRMPFRLKKAGKTFQRFINEVTNGLPDVFDYADDILVAKNNLVDHISALAELFTRLEKFRLRINFRKCQWIQPKYTF